MRKILSFAIASTFLAASGDAAITVNPITQADLDDLDSADIIWNVQYFPIFNSSQMSAGPGLNGNDSFASTTWSVSPVANSFIISYDFAGNLVASANGNGGATDQPTGPFNEIWLYLDVDSTFPVSGDVLDISNLTISKDVDDTPPAENFSVPSLEVTGGTGFVGQRIRFDDFSSNIGEFTLSGDLTQQFLSVGGKDWTVKAIGVQSPVPEPSSYVILLGLVCLALTFPRRKIR